MNLMTMRFKNFTWPVNPIQLDLECSRSVKETALPFAGAQAVDLGPKKRRVSGQSRFTGPDCMEQWKRLEAVFAQGGPGSLQLPGLEPFLAVMDSLKLLGREGAGQVRYHFSFTEYQRGPAYGGQGVHQAAAGESLWDYCGQYHWDFEALRRANPHIRDIAWLEAGEEVYSP